MNIFTNPMLVLGAHTFKANRLDLYETLVESLGDNASAAPLDLRATFTKWAQRDAARMEPRARVFANIAHRLSQGGITFSQALRPFIPNEEFLILSSGELTGVKGDLKHALHLVIRNIEASEKMNDSVVAAMAQPLIGIGSLLLMSFGYGAKLWPDFLRAINRSYWPAWTLPCIDVQLWMAAHWWILGFGGIAVGLYYLSLNIWTGPSRKVADRFPPWSINKDRQASNLLGILSALVSAGRTVRESLVLVRDNGTPYMRWHLNQMIHRYDISGEDAMAAMRTGLFSRPIMDRVEDAAANRTFDKTLAYVGDNALRLIVRTVHKQAQIVNGVCVFVIAVLILYITAVSVFGIQDATDAYLKTAGGGNRIAQ